MTNGNRIRNNNRFILLPPKILSRQSLNAESTEPRLIAKHILIILAQAISLFKKYVAFYFIFIIMNYMEIWEYELREDIFEAFLSNNQKAASDMIGELVFRKNGGLFYRYRPLNMDEINAIRFGQIYLCRAIRFVGRGDEWTRFRSYVSCFTDKKNSLSMWSDYADSGRGICLEYNFVDLEKFSSENRLVFSPVRYSDNEFSPGQKKDAALSMMWKEKIFSNESEWRLWKTDYHSSDIGKLMSSIHPQKIYMGKNMDTESELYEELLRLSEEMNIELSWVW